MGIQIIDKMEKRKEIRLERLKLAFERGYFYNPTTGILTTPKGNIVKRKTNGYFFFSIRMGNKKRVNVYVHQFAWYFQYKEVVDYIDHINGIRDDNRIINLRSVTNQENHFNNKVAKGYCFDKSRNKFLASIKLNGKQKNLGRFNSAKEARDTYLKAKKMYHVYEK